MLLRKLLLDASDTIESVFPPISLYEIQGRFSQ